MTEETVFNRAQEMPPHERAAFLDAACGGDVALRERLEVLLGAHDNPGSFLQRPASGLEMIADGPAARGSPDAPSQFLEVESRRIGPYKLLQKIGEGGMGTVYLAEQVAPVRRTVALKVIKPGMDSRQVLARFEAERQALAMMDHPNIAKVLDAGTTDQGRPYFVMELVKGVPITRDCDDRRLTLRERLALFIPVCQAVQHAHQKGIIHRDLKPSNVLVGLYDGRPIPKVIDFGVAKATGPKLTEATLFTGFGAVVGTPEYMSPEQAQLDNLDIDTRSDVYSLGVLLYQLLTGTTPLDPKRLKQAALLEVLRVIREEEPQRPSTRLSTTEGLPSIAASRNVEPAKLSRLMRGELDWIVMKALEKDRNRRYETANGFAMDLQRYLADDPVQACPPSATYRFRKFARRHRPVLAAASVVAASLVAVAVLSVRYADRQHRFAIDKAEDARKISALAGDLKRSLGESNRLLAIRNFDRGQAAFEKDQIGPGLLWMIESWRAAVAAGDRDWQHAARANLAAWRPHHARLKAVLSHESPVDAAAFSPDGKSVLTGGDDGLVQLWDAESGQPVGQPLNHPGTVFAVAFSPDGSSLITGCSDKMARLWHTATGQLIGSPFPHGGEVMAVAFSPDGKTILTGSTDNRAQLWDVPTGRPIGQPLLHEHSVLCVAYSPDGKSLLTGISNGRARRWEAATGQAIGSPFDNQLFCVGYSPDGRTVLTGGSDGTAKQWNAATGSPYREPIRHGPKVRAVAVSPDGRTVLTAGEDKTARLWDRATNQPISLPLVHQGPVVAVAFSPDGKTFLTASSDHTVRLWDADPGQPYGLIVDRRDFGRVVAFSRDGKSIAGGTSTGVVALWDAMTGRLIWLTRGHRGAITAAAVSPDGTRLLTGGDETARLWDMATGKPVGRTMQHPGGVTVVSFSPDGQAIMTGSPARTVRLWDATTGLPLGKPLPQPGSVDCGAFSPDGKSFVVGCDSGSVRVWDVATRAPRGEVFPHPGCVSAAAFSPDGRTLLTGCEDGGARLWDVETHRLRTAPLLHQLWVFAVAFNHDGTIVLTGSRNGTARLWDAATGMPLGRPIPQSALVWSLSTVGFSPDDAYFATGAVGDAARVFRKTPELPDDLVRVETWVGLVTGLRLDAEKGTIQALDNAAWRRQRDRLEQLGGPLETGGGPKLDPFPLSINPLTRVRTLMQRGEWDQAEAAFDELVHARPYNVSSWVEHSRFEFARGWPERAAANFRMAITSLPEHLGIRFLHVLCLLDQGDKAGLRGACADLLDCFGSLAGPMAANRVAWDCVVAPDAVADPEMPVRLAERAVGEAPESAACLNTLGAALYRAGRFSEAIHRLEEGIRQRGGESSPQDWVFLALAHHRLGQHAEAHAWLDRLRTYQPDRSDAAYWNELEIRLLRREAEAVILYDPIFPADPFAP
jgi:eukaryotic-like serine/threonine-protein kinase